MGYGGCSLVVCVVEYLSTWWDWLHSHDVPNWIAAFALPLLLWWLSTRRVNSVLGLAVHFAPGGPVTIGLNPHPVVNVLFINYTGSVVYVTGMWVQPNLKTFNMPADAGRDAARGKYLVAFLQGNELKARECTLQSNDKAVAAFALEQPMPEEFYKYRAPLWRRVLKRPKYFRFEYVVMIDTKRRLVAMIH
jgi:hypothetical protein